MPAISKTISKMWSHALMLAKLLISVQTHAICIQYRWKDIGKWKFKCLNYIASQNHYHYIIIKQLEGILWSKLSVVRYWVCFKNDI